MGNYNASEVESAICKIRGVIAARISFDPQGDPDELHVLASSARNPKQIVRDIESLCIAKFGMKIDHRRVSVAQIEAENSRESMPMGNSIRPSRIVESFNNGYLEAEVELTVGHASRYAKVSGPARGGNRSRLFALATIEALKHFTHDMYSFQLEDAFVTSLRKGIAAAVVLTLVLPDLEETLVGITWVKNNDGEAVVEACLNAVGRRIALTYADMVPDDDECSFEDAPAPLSPQGEKPRPESSGTRAQS